MSVADELFESEEIQRVGRTIVRRARWRRADACETAVIVKALDPDAVDARAAARWEHEYQVLRHLEGVGTPVPHAFMCERGVPQLVIEDVHGVTLRSLMDVGALTHTRTLRIAIQLADALMRIHARHVIHKDINPSNVLVFGHDDRVQFIDFGIASLLSAERPANAAAASVEGTLAYVSPEQTGCMNRALDQRSDFYSLGVTLYEALVGATPFTSTDALELIQAHVAKLPRTPHELDPRVPEVFSAIVMKLLAKAAEDRYQTAFGLKADLEACLDALGRAEEPQPFELGAHDDRCGFVLPQKLYGREAEVDVLLDAFERVSAGAVEALCISGAAGVGKTAVVHEVHKSLVQQRGRFLSGKFDQYQRDIPYQALIQAFQALVRQVLAEDVTSIQRCRDVILRALGAHGRILSNVIPELELLLGPQPEVAELEPAQAQERFHSVFLQLVRACATPINPLVLFLDDLQWADLPSLALIKLLTTTAGAAHLLVILAYRDQEVLEGHPARSMFDDMREGGATIERMHLEGLTSEDTAAFLADTLRQPTSQVRDLAALCARKTAGNAFFLGQFVLSLHDAGHIVFDVEQARFRWDMAQLERTPLTDNVVELLHGQLRALPRDTREIVRLAACLGNKFDLRLLASVAGYDVESTARAVWPALVSRFVLPQDETYKFAASHGDELAPSYRFLHDRVQQAAYALIPEAERAWVHRRVGSALLRTADEHEREERLFEIVNHLAAGRQLIVESAERLELVQLALAAFRKAKSANAFAPALAYVELALSLLGERGWETEFELTFQAHLERAVCECVLGHADEADQLFETALTRARTPLQRARVRSEMELLFLSLGKHQSVIDSVLCALSELGFVVPNASKPDEILAELVLLRERGRALLGDRKIEELRNLDEAVDPVAIQAHEHLDHLAPSAFFVNMNLYLWLGAQNFELAVRTGNSPRTPFNFSVCGLSNLVQGDFDTAFLLGKLSVELSDRYASHHHKAACYFHFCLINSWKQHYRIDERHAKLAHGFALEAWNHFFISWSAYAHVRALALMGAPLEKVARQAREYMGLVAKTNRENAAFLTAAERMAACLCGKTNHATSYDDDAFHEASFVRETCAYENPAPAFDYYIYKLQALFVLGHAREAQRLLAQAERFLSPQWVEVTEYYFYRALVAAAVHDIAADDEKPALVADVAVQCDKLAGFAAVNPQNFANRHLLVSAEHARLEGRSEDAEQLYDAAIQAAAEDEFVQNEAIAHELAAKFWRSQGRPDFATSHLEQALAKYRRWGADRKVGDLLERHPELEEVAQDAARTQSHTTAGEVPLFARIRAFDVASLGKAS